MPLGSMAVWMRVSVHLQYRLFLVMSGQLHAPVDLSTLWSRWQGTQSQPGRYGAPKSKLQICTLVTTVTDLFRLLSLRQPCYYSENAVGWNEKSGFDSGQDK